MARGRSVAIGLLVVVAACGSSAPSTSLGAQSPVTSVATAPLETSSTTVPIATFEYVGTVIESPDHGPEACAGFVRMSDPPQCRGIPIPNLAWEVVPWAETGRGSTWAGMVLTGTFDGYEMVLTSPPEPIPVDHVWEPPVLDFTPPCDEPLGGWSDARSGTVDVSAAVAYAESQGDFGGHWGYQPDPSEDRFVQVFTFTGDLASHARELESLYDGAICVGLAPGSIAELDQIRDHLAAVLWSTEASSQGIYPGLQRGRLISTWRDVTTFSVTVLVLAALDVDAAQEWLDLEFGVGVVVLSTVLSRVDI